MVDSKVQFDVQSWIPSTLLTIILLYQKSRSQEEVIKGVLTAEFAASILTHPQTYIAHELNQQLRRYVDEIDDAEALLWLVAHTSIRCSEPRSGHN
ncbi:hypothetical protein NMY22_g549 [Coprinellus aureogranulatus]|nr:hypothetical protein NMY22_g549 [Coprinellus aureogranulatus]